MRRARVIALGTLLAAGGAAWAGSAGKATANFLKMGVGAEGVAMGEAQTAAADDVMSLYWNPAGLGGLYQSEVGFMHNNYVQGVDHDVLYFARPTASLGVWGVGLSLLRVGDVEGYSASDVPIGNVEASDTLLTLGWARPWEDLYWFSGLQTGVNVKALRKTLDTESALGFMADLGLQYEAQSDWNAGLKTGLVIQNLGPGIAFDSDRSPLPLTVKLGVAYPLFGDNMTVAADAVLPTDGNLFANLGLDYRLWEILAFRVGYKGNNDLDSGLTYGFGVGNERLRLDYAYVPFGPFGDSHRVSLGARFGAVYRQTQVFDQVEVAYRRALARYAQGYLVDAYMQANQILTVAPWHRPAKLLSRRIESEFKQMADETRRQQLEEQVEEHFARGEQFFQVDDLLRARREFDAILALQPDHMGAKTYLNRIDERFQGITESFYDTAVKAFAANDFSQAAEYLDKALMLTPDHVYAKELRDKVAELEEKAAAAMEEAERARVIGPLQSSAQELFDQKQYVEAMAKCDEILKVDTANQEALRLRSLSKELAAKEYYNRALRAARNGDFKDAEKLLRDALRHKPVFPEAQSLLEKISQEGTRVDEEKSKELYRQALDAFLGGDLNRALALAHEAIALWPENEEARRLRDRLVRRGSGQ